ncbi:MAG TPA: hypothetical protein VF721_20215 [Pyrinomonadaceae bacterium]
MKILPARQPFVSLEGNLSVALPSQVQGFSPLSPKQLGLPGVTALEFTWKFQEGEVILSVINFPEGRLQGTEEELKALVANAKASFFQKFPQGKLLDEKAFKLGETPAYKIRYEMAENKYAIDRYYLLSNRLYRLAGIFQNSENEKFLNQAFDTFKLISKAEVEAERQRQFEALKPPALPQSPVAPKEKTDAEDENLKGKVKKIVQESEDLSGTRSVQGRKLSSVTYFNEKGNYVETDSYDFQGNLFLITMYGYIDGKRVSNSKEIRYEYDPPPAAAPKAKTNEPAAKPDNRYEYSFEYKYVNGKLAEEQMFFNDGKKGMRYVYNHKGNQVEKLVYTTEGELNQKYLVTLDKDGNEIEEISYGLANYNIYGDRKYRYTYEFDDKGNWIKRITQTETTENGAASFKPGSVTYRTITYF